MNIESSLAYLDQLPTADLRASRPLAQYPIAQRLASPPADSNAGVMNSQLIAFTSNLESKYKEAVKYSAQIAQRAADSKFDQLSQRMEWYAVYAKTLQHAGWVGTENKLTEYKSSEHELSMEQVALELIKLAAGPNAAIIAELTRATIDALKKDGGALSKLQTSSSSGSSGAFDILPCLQNGDDVVMYNHAMVFETSSNSGGFWFWSWKSKHVNLKHAANEWTFNHSHYLQVEQKIKEILGASSNDFFDGLELG